MLTEVADVNSIYEESLSNLRDRVPIDNGKGKSSLSVTEKEHAAKDYYANVRTNVLLAWVLSNVGVSFFIFLMKWWSDFCFNRRLGPAAGCYPERDERD